MIIVSHSEEKAITMGIAKTPGVYIVGEARTRVSLGVTVSYSKREQLLEAFFWIARHSENDTFDYHFDWNV